MANRIVKQYLLKRPAKLILILAIVILVIASEIVLIKSLFKCPEKVKENYYISPNSIDNETASMINRLFEQKGVGVRIITDIEEYIQKLGNYIDRSNLSRPTNTSK